MAIDFWKLSNAADDNEFVTPPEQPVIQPLDSVPDNLSDVEQGSADLSNDTSASVDNLNVAPYHWTPTGGIKQTSDYTELSGKWSNVPVTPPSSVNNDTSFFDSIKNTASSVWQGIKSVPEGIASTVKKTFNFAYMNYIIILGIIVFLLYMFIKTRPVRITHA